MTVLSFSLCNNTHATMQYLLVLLFTDSSHKSYIIITIQNVLTHYLHMLNLLISHITYVLPTAETFQQMTNTYHLLMEYTAAIIRLIK